jgi:4-alpha-glucanotransferase
VLRIDHIPAFHRLYWIPEGREAGEGVYVRYAAEELYALFNLESHRHRTLLVGEDLGTVPPEVPESMEQHGVHRMYVLQYAVRPDPEAALPPPPATAVASLNTHDMPPFAAFLNGTDIGERAGLELLGGQDPSKEWETRRALVDALRLFLNGLEPTTELVDDAILLRACLEHLARSDARLVLVNLEDLWLERQSQNIPSSSDRHPNWRNKAKVSLERLDALCRVRDLLDAVNHARHGRS